MPHPKNPQIVNELFKENKNVFDGEETEEDNISGDKPTPLPLLKKIPGYGYIVDGEEPEEGTISGDKSAPTPLPAQSFIENIVNQNVILEANQVLNKIEALPPNPLSIPTLGDEIEPTSNNSSPKPITKIIIEKPINNVNHVDLYEQFKKQKEQSNSLKSVDEKIVSYLAESKKHEEQKLANEKHLAEEARITLEKQQKAEQKQKEQEKKAVLEKEKEAKRLIAEQQKAEQKRKEHEHKATLKKEKEAKRLIAEQQKAEQKRKEHEHKAALKKEKEAKRLIAEQQKAEQKCKEQEQKATLEKEKEAKRLIVEQQKIEQKRKEQEHKATLEKEKEAKRLIAEQQKAEQKRKEQEQKATLEKEKEAKRLIVEQQKAEQKCKEQEQKTALEKEKEAKRLIAEQQKAEQKRKEQEQKIALEKEKEAKRLIAEQQKAEQKCKEQEQKATLEKQKELETKRQTEEKAKCKEQEEIKRRADAEKQHLEVEKRLEEAKRKELEKNRQIEEKEKETKLQAKEKRTLNNTKEAKISIPEVLAKLDDLSSTISKDYKYSLQINNYIKELINKLSVFRKSNLDMTVSLAAGSFFVALNSIIDNCNDNLSDLCAGEQHEANLIVNFNDHLQRAISSTLIASKAIFTANRKKTAANFNALERFIYKSSPFNFLVNLLFSKEIKAEKIFLEIFTNIAKIKSNFNLAQVPAVSNAFTAFTKQQAMMKQAETVKLVEPIKTSTPKAEKKKLETLTMEKEETVFTEKFLKDGKAQLSHFKAKNSELAKKINARQQQTSKTVAEYAAGLKNNTNLQNAKH